MVGVIVRHGAQKPGVIEHRQGDLVESVVGRAYAEEVGHNRIDGRGLAEGQHNCRVVVASRGRFSPGGGGADGFEDGLLEDQFRQFKVRVSDGAIWVGEADKILGDVSWPLPTIPSWG